MKLTFDQKSSLKKRLSSFLSEMKKEAVVYSTYSLSEKEKELLINALSSIYGEVNIKNELDSSLLGGLIVEIDSQRIDLSLSAITK